MPRLSDISLRTKVTLLSTILLIAACAALTAIGQRELARSYQHEIAGANEIALHLAAEQIGDIFMDVQIDHDADGTVSRFVWPGMPDRMSDVLLDETQEITGVGATVFRLDEASRDLVRMATTFTDENGNRGTGTSLGRNAAYETLMRGEVYSARSDVLGTEHLTYYMPIFDGAGQVVGAIATASPLSDFHAALMTKFFNKLIMISLVMVLTVATLFFAMRAMMRPLELSQATITKLADGELDIDVEGTDRGDEFGAIAKSLSVLQASMRNAEDLRRAEAERAEADTQKQRDQAIVVEALTEGLERLGKLDLTKQIESSPDAPFPTDYEGLRTSFNMLVDSLSDTVAAIREVADEVNRDAREMAGSSVDLSGRTESQAATLEQSAAALEELSESVRSTAENATDAETTTSENRAVAKRTGEIVEDAISAMSEIEASSQQINQIISVIDDIAFQTNLLALNAGVEAARAGEAGRGFAVVASEVRALAQHSSASAQEIKSLIAASSEQVESGSKLVRKAGAEISDIIERVDRVAGLVSDIAVSAKEQSVGVTEINSGVRDLDAATQRNAAMAEEASAASEGLTNAADKLANHLSRFKITQAQASANWASAAADKSSTEREEAVQAFAPRAVANGAPSRPAPSANNPQSNVFQDF